MNCVIAITITKFFGYCQAEELLSKNLLDWLSVYTSTRLRYDSNMPMTVQKATQLLRAFYQSEKRLPTFAELAVLCGYHSKFSCVRLVKKLITADIIAQDPSGKLLPKQLFSLVHVVQRTVGNKTRSVAERSVNFSELFRSLPSDCFAITVADDAMSAEGIYSGDVVVIDCQREVTNGAIVAVFLQDSWCIRYYLRQQKAIILESANDLYLPVYPKKKIEIGGVVMLVIRDYTHTVIAS